MNKPITVTILGCRGSIPVSGEQFSHYGGATTCVLVRVGDQIAVFDAGTGILNLPDHLHGEQEIPIFLSHCHADHILGLPMCPAAFNKDQTISVYGAPHAGRDIAAQVRALISPPLWPVEPHQLPADIRFYPIPPAITLGDLLVESMDGCHPGGVTVYRVSANGKRIVFMTDCSITEENRASLLEFCRDCDLLLCDGQYTEEEWPTRSTFGHNCMTHVAQFANDCGAKTTRLLHHDNTHTDQFLNRAQIQVHAINSTCSLAFEGEEITL